ncbi:hypothetical protein ACP4OV_013030 [Aristida adscensionis]
MQPHHTLADLKPYGNCSLSESIQNPNTNMEGRDKGIDKEGDGLMALIQACAMQEARNDEDNEQVFQDERVEDLLVLGARDDNLVDSTNESGSKGLLTSFAYKTRKRGGRTGPDAKIAPNEPSAVMRAILKQKERSKHWSC